ncbi:ATP-binding protein [Peptoniphilus timonensis]|uniref:ATP-binding protein n=1 Tax=Peptoniphilus timonensis TaxID=1268254 RepID=UPI001FEEBD59|nr:hypothetical protein [Peptoniphilus timonensis]
MKREKSTIVNFIDGIFYGFSKDSLARKIRDDLFEKSRPWGSNLYKGYIILKDEDKEYRISRDFDKDEISIVNIETGEDFSFDDKNYLNSRIPQPGILFFDINRKIYKSSFFISQRLSQIENEAGEELKNRIDNFSVSEDENIDLNKVVDKMNDDLYKLGNKRRKTSEIGRITEELDKISLEKINYLSLKDSYNKSTDEYKKAKEKLKDLEDKLRGRKIFELENLRKELNEIENNNSNENKYNLTDLEEAIELNKSLGIYSSKLDDLISLEGEKFEVDKDLENDYNRYKEINRELFVLNENNFSKEIEIISRDIKSLNIEIMKYLIKFISSFIIAIGIIIASIHYKKYFISIFSVLFFTYSYFRFVKFRENKDLLERLNRKLNDFKKKSRDKTFIKKEFDKEIKDILLKYNAKDSRELGKILDLKVEENLKNKSKNEYNDQLKEKNFYEIEEIKKKIIDYERELEIIFEKYKVKNIKDLKEVFHDKRNKSDDRSSEYRYRIDELEKESLSGEIYKKSSIEEISKDISTTKREISNLEGSLRTLEGSLEKLRILEEKTFELNRKLKELDYRKKLLEISIEKIENFMKSKRRSTLPILKNEISNYLSLITDNKYSEILIDDSLAIRVYDKSISDYIDLESLSIGTLDQIYLAFRLAVSKIITDKKIPIVLDSHFDSYDDDRLKNTLEILQDEEQVLIFASSNREKDILDKNNMTYKLIKL